MTPLRGVDRAWAGSGFVHVTDPAFGLSADSRGYRGSCTCFQGWDAKSFPHFPLPALSFALSPGPLGMGALGSGPAQLPRNISRTEALSVWGYPVRTGAIRYSPPLTQATVVLPVSSTSM